MARHRRKLGGYSEEEHASVEVVAQRRDVEVVAEAVADRGDAEVGAPGEGVGDNFFCKIYKHG